MTNHDFLAAVAASSGVSQANVSKVLAAVREAVTLAVSKGDKVTLTDLGTFERVHRAARVGRNPQSGEEIEIAAKNAPVFKPAKALKDAVR